jgi:hypothetical protein
MKCAFCRDEALVDCPKCGRDVCYDCMETATDETTRRMSLVCRGCNGTADNGGYVDAQVAKWFAGAAVGAIVFIVFCELFLHG